MDDYQAGEMTIISDDNTYFTATYSIAPRRDGRLEINEWSQLLRDCEFKIRDRWISVLHHGHARVFLFFKIVPKGEEYHASSYDG
jgi:hypothetical protein